MHGSLASTFTFGLHTCAYTPAAALRCRLRRACSLISSASFLAASRLLPSAAARDRPNSPEVIRLACEEEDEEEEVGINVEVERAGEETACALAFFRLDFSAGLPGEGDRCSCRPERGSGLFLM